MLAAHRSNHFLAAVVGSEIPCVPMHDGIAQLGRPRHRRVLGEVTLNGGDRRILDVLRCRKMRLASAKIDHVDALAAQLVSLGHDSHGGGRFNAVDAFSEF